LYTIRDDHLPSIQAQVAKRLILLLPVQEHQMARYFFNVHDGVSIADTVGSEHVDIESARSEAVETIAERLRGTMLKNADISAWLMNVVDESGFTVIVLSFTAAVKIIERSDSANAEIVTD
jgi:hypothetical protein